MKVDVARIKTGNDKDDFLTSPDLSLETNAAGDVTVLDLKGKFASGSGLTVSIKPDAKGKSKLAIHADNAGEALAAMDLYDTMIGGVLDVRGVQMPGRGVNDIAGRAEISNFSIVKAPVLAKLINLLSLSGLGELLQNKGIEFQKLRSDFEWKQTPQGRVIAVKDGKTSGASIGLTFAGTINQDKKTTDLSGTFVPMSQINGFLGRIPLLGNLLTGGKNGGVIAATYSLRGNSDNPTTFINPLSVLTPGFLRSLLFENGSGFLSEVGAGDDAEPSAAPVEKKAYNR